VVKGVVVMVRYLAQAGLMRHLQPLILVVAAVVPVLAELQAQAALA
jgi:hypothetical protein